MKEYLIHIKLKDSPSKDMDSNYIQIFKEKIKEIAEKYGFEKYDVNLYKIKVPYVNTLTEQIEYIKNIEHFSKCLKNNDQEWDLIDSIQVIESQVIMLAYEKLDDDSHPKYDIVSEEIKSYPEWKRKEYNKKFAVSPLAEKY